jgi:hypothetical protein
MRKLLPSVFLIAAIIFIAKLLTSGYVVYKTDTYNSNVQTSSNSWFDLYIKASDYTYNDGDSIYITVTVANKKGQINRNLILNVFNPSIATLKRIRSSGFSFRMDYKAPGYLGFFRNKGEGYFEPTDAFRSNTGNSIGSYYSFETTQKILKENEPGVYEFAIIPQSENLSSFGMPIRIGARIQLDFKGIPGEAHDLFLPNYQMEALNPENSFQVDQGGYWSNFITIYPDPSIALNPATRLSNKAKILWIDEKFMLDDHSILTYSDEDDNDYIDQSVTYSYFTQFVADERFTDLFITAGSLDSTGRLNYAGLDSVDYTAKFKNSYDNFLWMKNFTGFHGVLNHKFGYSNSQIDFSLDSLSFTATHDNIITSAKYICDSDKLNLNGLVLNIDDLYENDQGLNNQNVMNNITNLIIGIKTAIAPKQLILQSPPMRIASLATLDTGGHFWTDSVLRTFLNAGVDYFSLETYNYNNINSYLFWYENVYIIGASHKPWGISNKADYTDRITTTLEEMYTLLPELKGKLIVNLIGYNGITDKHTIFETVNSGRIGLFNASDNAKSMLAGVGLYKFVNGSGIDYNEWMQFRETFASTGAIPRMNKIMIGKKGGHIVSADGRAKITIPENILTEDVEFSIDYVNTYDKDHVSPVYKFEPAGYGFSKPVKLSLTYDPDEIPEGFSENNLSIAKLNDSKLTATNSNKESGDAQIIFTDISELGEFVLIPAAPTAIGENDSNLPKEFSLSPNYPNPFNSSTTITFTLPKKSRARLVVFNLLGQKIKVLNNTELPAGEHHFTWDGRNEYNHTVASAVYIYRLDADAFHSTKKMIFLK